MLQRLSAIITLGLGLTGLACPSTFTTLDNFNGTDGKLPHAVLIQAADGKLYGTTFEGGASNNGAIFKMNLAGVLTSLYSFCTNSGCPDGAGPTAALAQGTDGNFFGTTSRGGAANAGTVFTLTPAGQLTTLHSFCSLTSCLDGSVPLAGLIQASDGNFYGVTEFGGSHHSGTIFQITPAGALTVIYNFCSTTGCADGANPTASLIQATDGNLYGTTPAGGVYRDGTVFKITLSGALTTLYSFCAQPGCRDGSVPEAGLVQAGGGNFYGTTVQGGATGYGTVFKINPHGMLQVVYSFCSQNGCIDGYAPTTGLIQAFDTNLYGVTSQGGANGRGNIFQLTTGGTVSTLYSFCRMNQCPGGAYPLATLVETRNGALYGTTGYGGTHGDGAIFALGLY